MGRWKASRSVSVHYGPGPLVATGPAMPISLGAAVKIKSRLACGFDAKLDTG